jgi:hypothetical protein
MRPLMLLMKNCERVIGFAARAHPPVRPPRHGKSYGRSDRPRGKRSSEYPHGRRHPSYSNTRLSRRDQGEERSPCGGLDGAL